MTALFVKQLHCEHRTDPIGLDVRKPRFSWQLQSDVPHTLQAAYRLQAAGEPDGFEQALMWDTGRTASDRSVLVEYDGPELQQRSRYYYRVKAWDRQGRESPWSEVASWEMGLLGPDDWTAEWITPDAAAVNPQAEAAFLLRKEFAVRASVARATIYATSLGLYELELNGERVGDWQFTPGWTSYSHRLQAQAYDVTGSIRGGATNALGAALANGWYKGHLGWKGQRDIFGDVRALLLQLHIEYTDGTSEVVRSDGTWRAATGPILMSELYHGETYDARLERAGWSRSGYDDSGWATVAVVSHAKNIVVMQENEPARVTERLKPIAVLRTPAGETVLDMGQNMVGRLHVRLAAAAGTRLTLQHAEVLDRDGNFYTGNLRSAKQTVQYVCKGGGEESYAPHFSFQGFRYVKIEGWPEGTALDPERFRGEVIHTDMEPTGSFECSHPLLNQLQRNIVWGQRGNFLDVPTDCPQRDERLGWTGDAQMFIRTAAFNYGVAPFFTKWLRDLKVDQHPDGGVPSVIPDALGVSFAHSSAAWGDAAVVCPWTVYLCYGDTRVLEEQFDSMKAWVEYIRAQGDDELLWNTGFHYGDWLGLDAKEGSYVGATPRDLIATCFYAYSTSLVVKAAEVLGRSEDAARYRELHERIVAAFAKEFLTPNGRLAAHTQTAHVLPLMFGLVDGPVRERLARTLAAYVEEQKGHLTTGFVGTPYLCHVLTENGYHDLAVKLVQQEDYPSWLYAIRQGATTIWEHWDGIKPDGTFWSDDMNSYNHYAYGSVGDWLYRAVAGIDLDERAPGYKRILFRPRPDSGLGYAKASLETAYGTIRSEWRKEGAGAGGDGGAWSETGAGSSNAGATAGGVGGGDGTGAGTGDGELESTSAGAGAHAAVGVVTTTYEFELPPNTTAVAVLRGTPLAAASVNGQPARQAEGVLAAEQTDTGELRLELGSGTYRVVVRA